MFGIHKAIFRLFFPLLAFGGGSSAQQQDTSKQDKEYEDLKKSYEKSLSELSDSLDGFQQPTFTTPEPTKPTSPASTTTTAEQAQAEADARAQAAKRRGLLATIAAGESQNNNLLGSALGNQGKLGA